MNKLVLNGISAILTYGLILRKIYGVFWSLGEFWSSFQVVFLSVIELMERLSDQIIVSCVKKKRKEKTENKGNGLKIK